MSLCTQCHFPVKSGGNQHKKGHCHLKKKTSAQADLLAAQIGPTPVLIPTKKLEPREMRVSRSRY